MNPRASSGLLFPQQAAGNRTITFGSCETTTRSLVRRSSIRSEGGLKKKGNSAIMLSVRQILFKTFIASMVCSIFGYVASAPWTPVAHAQIEQQVLPRSRFFEEFLKLFAILQKQWDITPSPLTTEEMGVPAEGQQEEETTGSNAELEDEQTTGSNAELEDEQRTSKSNLEETEEGKSESSELPPDEKAMAQFVIFGAAVQTQVPSQTDEQHESPALSSEERAMVEFLVYTASVR